MVEKSLRLGLSAVDLRNLMPQWPAAMVEDYIQILTDLVEIINELNANTESIAELFDEVDNLGQGAADLMGKVARLKAKIKFARQEVFIGSQPLINYPATSYSDLGGGLYLQSVNT